MVAASNSSSETASPPKGPKPSEAFLARKMQRPLNAEDQEVAARYSADRDAVMAKQKDLQEELEQWRRCSGLHTVQEWVLNYKKHPAGWAALLMIHGIPEVTGRLRSKVENYAIYSALFRWVVDQVRMYE